MLIWVYCLTKIRIWCNIGRYVICRQLCLIRPCETASKKMKTNHQNKATGVVEGYGGRVLHKTGSSALHERIVEVLKTLQELEKMKSPVMPYLAAWEEGKKIIWYEFVSPKLCHLLKCSAAEAAKTFSDAVIDQRIYKYTGPEAKLEEEIITKDELGGHRKGLREEVKKAGSVDVVYKIEVMKGKYLWLKDQANIEKFSQDNVYLSIGFLTDVTKEMEQKDLFEKIGYFDELTNLPKRSIMERIFEINLGNYRRSKIDDFVFMMIDVDYFKAVNDRFGHQAGDYVLAALAGLMTIKKRKEDEIGRYGGEEFYAFSLGHIKPGVQFAERLRRSVEGYRFAFDDAVIPITISIGVASASQLGDKDQLLADKLIELADQRLYVAKQTGRNRVVWEDQVKN